MKTKLIPVLPAVTCGLALLLACTLEKRDDSAANNIPPLEATNFDPLMEVISQDLQDRRNWVLPSQSEALRKVEP